MSAPPSHAAAAGGVGGVPGAGGGGGRQARQYHAPRGTRLSGGSQHAGWHAFSQPAVEQTMRVPPSQHV